jgi:superfamily II RNA helicase
MEEIIDYPFKLDDWQLNSIKKLCNKESVLITAHTGCGKTIPAECSIKYGVLYQHKKVIYTSPIKALSNQKFMEFTNKFEKYGITVGIMTGDIKLNPDADCLIMTTEILRNLLYSKYIKRSFESQSLGIEYELNIDNVCTVIFDEVHYINDKERGKVWEETLIMLPKEINILMLSATISGIENFKSWVEKVRNNKIYLYGTTKRVIPLTHYYYLHMQPKKNIKPNELILLEEHCDKLIEITDENNNFKSLNYDSMLNLMNKSTKFAKINSHSLLNNVIKFLKEKEMIPALFFTLSRKKCDMFANQIEHTLNTTQEAAQVEKIINNQLVKLDNKDDYIRLESFYNTKNLLMKGIGVHHSGVLPIFKEITEILFSRYLIKVLFVTETFAVGINMPAKTVLFTGLTKYDESGMRLLLTHEYLQMSGRAGRRGLDKIGRVIHLPNLYDPPSNTEIQRMILGNSQIIESKFQIGYQFILKALNTDNISPNDIMNSSLLNHELENFINELKNKLENYELENNKFKYEKELDKYHKLKNPEFKLSSKTIKENNKKMSKIKSLSGFNEEYQKYLSQYEKLKERERIKEDHDYYKNMISNEINTILNLLSNYNYIENNKLTIKGVIASNIGDCNELLLTEIIYQKILDNLTIEEIPSILSIFTDEKYISDLYYPTYNIEQSYNKIYEITKELSSEEHQRGLFINNWDLNNNMFEIIYNWVNDKIDIGSIDMFQGDFVKCINKISCIICKLADLYLMIENSEMSNKCIQANEKIMKGVVKFDSLYIKQ